MSLSQPSTKSKASCSSLVASLNRLRVCVDCLTRAFSCRSHVRWACCCPANAHPWFGDRVVSGPSRANARPLSMLRNDVNREIAARPRQDHRQPCPPFLSNAPLVGRNEKRKRNRICSRTVRPVSGEIMAQAELSLIHNLLAKKAHFTNLCVASAEPQMRRDGLP